MRKRKSNFIIQGSILAITSVIVRLIGILYRVPLTNMIGTAGMGYYSSAFQIYSILLLLSSYSLPLAVSKMVSARMAKREYRNAYRIFETAILYAVAVGIIAALITYLGADFFAGVVLKRPMCAYAIRTLAPTVLLMAFLGVLRGFFQGLGTMIPTALSQVIEQVVNGGGSLAAAYFLLRAGRDANLVFGRDDYTAAFGAAGGTIGTGLGALAAFLFLVFLFVVYRRVLHKKMRKDHTEYTESYSDAARILIFTVVPVILSSAVYNLSAVIDDGIFGHCMVYLKMSADQISTLWGEYSAKYHLLTNVPIAIASALASSMIPSLTKSMANNNRGQVIEKVGTSIRFSMLIAIPAAVGLMVLAAPIMNLLFRGDNSQAIKMMMFGSTAVIFYSLSTITNAILQGINHLKDPVRHSLYSLVIHVVALILMLLVFKLGIYSVVAANILFAACMCLFNGIAIGRYLDYRQEWVKTILMPTLASLVMGAVTLGVYMFFNKFIKVDVISVIMSIVAAAAVYGILLLKFKCVDEIELYQIPKGDALVSLARKLHLL